MLPVSWREVGITEIGAFVSWVPAYESTQAEHDGNQYYWEKSGRLWRKRFELEQAISAFESAGYTGSNIALDYSSS